MERLFSGSSIQLYVPTCDVLKLTNSNFLLSPGIVFISPDFSSTLEPVVYQSFNQLGREQNSCTLLPRVGVIDLSVDKSSVPPTVTV